jgi:hypothetical protein
MLNLTYQGTRDEDVYRKISECMKDRVYIFGGIPYYIDDNLIEDFEKFEELADTHLYMRKEVTNIFGETWRKTVKTEDKWGECTKVLSRKDIEMVMSAPWGKN